MLRSQIYKLYALCKQHCKEEDISAIVGEIEVIVNRKTEADTCQNGSYAGTKQVLEELKADIRKHSSDLIQWMFLFFIGYLVFLFIIGLLS